MSFTNFVFGCLELLESLMHIALTPSIILLLLMHSKKNPFRFTRLFFCKTIFLFVSAILLTSCSTQNKNTLDKIDFSYEVCLDPTQTHSVSEWHVIPFESLENLQLGFYRGAIWIKFKISNHSDVQKELVIKNDDVFNRNYRFYEYEPTKNTLIQTGNSDDLTYEDDRSFNCPNPNFKITIEPHNEKTFIQHITSDGRVVQVTPTLFSLSNYVVDMNETTIGNFLFYGIILIVFLINLTYWRTFKTKIYFFYTFYILSSMLFYAGLEGYLFGLGISNHLIDHFVFVSLYFLLLLFTLFSAHFLNIYSISPIFTKYLKHYSWLFVALLAYQIVFYNTSIAYLHVTLNVVTATVLILVFAMLGMAIKERRHETKFYLTALLSYLVFVIIGLVDSHLDLFPGSYKTYFKVGFIIELVIFTYTVATVLARGDNRRLALEAELIDSNKAKEETLQRLNELSHKNDALKSTISQIKEDKIEKTDLLAIFKLLESNLSEEQDWLNFKTKFEELNPNFLTNLFSEHSDLSKSEIRLLTLIKIGFTQKEIAKILYVAEDSVKKAKQRVRKKLNIASTVTLPDYLLGF